MIPADNSALHHMYSKRKQLFEIVILFHNIKDFTDFFYQTNSDLVIFQFFKGKIFRKKEVNFDIFLTQNLKCAFRTVII